MCSENLTSEDLNNPFNVFSYTLQDAYENADNVCAVSFQLQNRQLGSHNKVRATVAPLPSAASGPPPAKASRPALSFLSSSRRRAPTPTRRGEDNDDSDCVLVQ